MQISETAFLGNECKEYVLKHLADSDLIPS